MVLSVSESMSAQASQGTAGAQQSSEYTLGPEDQIRVWASATPEVSENPLRIDPAGFVDFPVLGRIKAKGLTLEQLRSELIKRLSVEVREPRVSIDILEFGSQPVSVIGAVREPGVHQLRGRRTLAEVLSLAGGIAPEAGSKIRIARAEEWGEIPLPGVTVDPASKSSIAEVNLKDFLSANKPAENIVIRPNDVITVPRAEMIYVVGAVRKPGGFTLSDRQTVSALQAVAMAEGLGTTTAATNSKIIRTVPGGQRQEIDIDLKKVLQGKAPDMALLPDDILFVPDSASKRAATRALELTLQTLSGMAIFRGF
jgi:polysaccharide export outer membrane protein